MTTKPLDYAEHVIRRRAGYDGFGVEAADTMGERVLTVVNNHNRRISLG